MALESEIPFPWTDLGCDIWRYCDAPYLRDASGVPTTCSARTCFPLPPQLRKLGITDVFVRNGGADFHVRVWRHGENPFEPFRQGVVSQDALGALYRQRMSELVDLTLYPDYPVTAGVARHHAWCRAAVALVMD